MYVCKGLQEVISFETVQGHNSGEIDIYIKRRSILKLIACAPRDRMLVWTCDQMNSF